MCEKKRGLEMVWPTYRRFREFRGEGEVCNSARLREVRRTATGHSKRMVGILTEQMRIHTSVAKGIFLTLCIMA